MRASLVINALVAVLVGFGGTLAILVAAAQALGASPIETVSGVSAVCLALAVSSAFLSIKTRMPMITAWSTPGAALVAATDGSISMAEAVGCYIAVAVAILATAYLRPLTRLIEALPTGVAAGMLAGVLIKFVIGAFDQASDAPILVLSLIGLFLLLRAINPSWAVIGVLAIGIALVFGLGAPLGVAQSTLPEGLLRLSDWSVITPEFDWAALIGLGLPLYLVTMAAQNLPGFAVLKASGYEPPVRTGLSVTGLCALASAPFGAVTSNMAAITAAICTGPDTHPDPAKRWLAGPIYGFLYLLLAIGGASLVALFAALPGALIATIAGLALVAALGGSLATALNEDAHRIPAVIALCATASDLSLFGIGSAFWGLVAGLLALGFESALKRRG
ncbi:MAG: benzoate/H(+) symporter BenE family transporter [Alphaproteobacteria bacterium]|nr:benzoate/H(+) symporter BenE family transporter [Alphaproteobacteria bacterium]